MTRFVLATLLTLLAATAWCGQKEDLLAKKISYENPGASVEVLLKSLATKTGLPLEASPRTAKEILAVRVQGVATSELLGKIAEVVGGSWKQEKVALRLIQSDDDLRAEQQRERNLDGKRIERDLKIRREALQSQSNFDKVAASALVTEAVSILSPTDDAVYWDPENAVKAKLPIGRALDRILSSFELSDYLNLPSGQRVVYSSSPNRTQRPFGKVASAALSKLIREQAEWVEAVDKSRIQFKEDSDKLASILQTKEPIDSSCKVNVALYRKGSGSTVEAFFNIYSENGNLVNTTYATLGGSTYKEIAIRPKPPGELPIKPSEEEVALVRQMSWLRDLQLDLLSPAQWEMVLNPEKHEPLSLVYGKQLVTLSKHFGKNLAASLADTMCEGILRSVDPPQLPTAMMNRLGTFQNIRETDQWMLVRPYFPSAARLRRVDRRTLGAYLRLHKKQNNPNFEEIAKWSLSFPLEERHLGRSMIMMIPGVRSRVYEPAMMRLYGTLTSDQRDAAMAKGLAFRTLSSDQLSLVGRLLYGRAVDLSPDEEGLPDHLRRLDHLPPIYDEATEGVPNGIPADGYLKMSMESETVAVEQGGSYSIQELGRALFRRTQPELYRKGLEACDGADFDNLIAYQVHRYSFKFYFHGFVLMKATFEDSIKDPSGAVGFKAFSEEMRKAIDAAKEKCKQEYEVRKKLDKELVSGSRSPT